MKVSDLIDKLSKLDGSLEVAIFDGFNGGGNPRTINFGPTINDTHPKFYDLDVSDIFTKSGKIVVMGYGCY